MKKLILTFGIFLAGIVFVSAQDAANPSSKILNHITTVCALSPAQASQVKPITEALVKARQDAKQKYAGNPDAMKSNMKTINEGFRNQLKTILTPDQMEKLKADMQSRNKAGEGDNSNSTAAPKN